MSDNVKLMSFDEFRAASGDAADQAHGEAARQQLAFVRDAAAADGLLRPEALSGMSGWVQWPDGGLAFVR